VNLSELPIAVDLKMKFRGRELTDAREHLLRKEARLKKLWELRLSSQMSALPEFDQVFRAVLRELRQAGFFS
jgi:hypothetical protein